jgi:hypothetical protein
MGFEPQETRDEPVLFESLRDPDDQADHDRRKAWEVTLRYRDLRRLGSVGEREKGKLAERAVAGVLEKAATMLGPLQTPLRPIEGGLQDWLEAGLAGELDVEATLGDPQQEPRFTLLQKAPPRSVLLLLDTSLSMRAEKQAWLAVAVAAVALSVPSSHLALLAFGSDVDWLQRFGEAQPIEHLVRRLLELPPGGMTHIEKALRAGAEELARTGLSKPHVLLVSDGRYTEGLDPVFLAPGWDRLHALKLGREPWGRQVMIDAARLGGGQFFEARREEELPRVLYQAVRKVLT